MQQTQRRHWNTYRTKQIVENINSRHGQLYINTYLPASSLSTASYNLSDWTATPFHVPSMARYSFLSLLLFTVLNSANAYWLMGVGACYTVAFIRAS